MTPQPDRRPQGAAPAPARAGRWACALLAATSVLLLAACQARLTLDISVTADGGGQLSVTLGADEALLAESAAAGADPLADFREVGRALADDGWRVTERADEEGRAVTLVVGFDDPGEFNALAATLGDALAAPEVRLIEALTLVADGRELRLAGAVGAEPGPGVADFGLEPGEAVALVTAADAFAYEVTVTLPGELVATSAAEPVMPLRWRVPPGERVDILAVTEQPPPRWWLGAAAAAALLGAAAALAWWRVHRRARRRAGRAWT